VLLLRIAETKHPAMANSKIAILSLISDMPS